MSATQHNNPQLDLILAALASEKRRAIIHYLSLRPATLSQLASWHGMSLPGLRKHTRILEDSELIIRKKSGRVNFVALNAATLKIAQDWITQYHTEWSSPQATLDNYVSRMQE